MDWPIPLLHIVRGENVDHAGKLEKEIVLETEHGSGSDNSSLGEDAPDCLFSSALQESVRPSTLLISHGKSQPL